MKITGDAPWGTRLEHTYAQVRGDSVSPPPLIAMVEGSCGRRRRSRSSPVRCRDSKSEVGRSEARRDRSPSVTSRASSPSPRGSSRRRVLAGAPVLSPALSCQRLEQCSPGDAYFSPKPPPAPIRLVALAPTRAARADAATDGLAFISPDTITLREKKVSARNRRRIRSLLREIIAALPLVESTEPSAALVPPPAPPRAASTTSIMLCSRHKKEPQLSEDVKGKQRARSAAIVTPDTATSALGCSEICRSIAIQAYTTRATGDTGPCAQSEWVGGVRALRDSHVRLVVRQLRHIERLNRALDRAAASAPAATSAPAAAAAPASTPDMPLNHL